MRTEMPTVKDAETLYLTDAEFHAFVDAVVATLRLAHWGRQGSDMTPQDREVATRAASMCLLTVEHQGLPAEEPIGSPLFFLQKNEAWGWEDIGYGVAYPDHDSAKKVLHEILGHGGRPATFRIVERVARNTQVGKVYTVGDYSAVFK
jgi:hypothetical protein